jgi:hypothetical protein
LVVPLTGDQRASKPRVALCSKLQPEILGQESIRLPPERVRARLRCSSQTGPEPLQFAAVTVNPVGPGSPFQHGDGGALRVVKFPEWDG